MGTVNNSTSGSALHRSSKVVYVGGGIVVLLFVLLSLLSGSMTTEELDDRTSRWLRAEAVDTEFKKAVFHPQQFNLVNDGNAGRDTVMLFGIFSHDKDDEQAQVRDMIRSTYLQHDQVCSLPDYIHTVQSKAPSNCKVVYTFVIGEANAPTRITRYDHFRTNNPMTLPTDLLPANKEEDCTYLNVIETINDGKTPSWFKYGAHLSQLYDMDYIAKVDADSLVNMDYLLSYMKSDLPPYPYNVRTYGGSMVFNSKRLKLGHLYAFGQFCFLSRDMAHYITNGFWVDRHAVKDKGIGFKDGMAERTKAEDIDTANLVWTHPYPIKVVFMNSRIPWIHRIKQQDQWMSLWNETQGNPPLSRVVGHYEMPVKPGAWTKHLEKQTAAAANNSP